MDEMSASPCHGQASRIDTGPRQPSLRWRSFSSIALALTLVVGPALLGSGIASAQTTGPAAPPQGSTPIKITIGSTVMQGHLNASTMAQSLAKRLPMTVQFIGHPDGGGFPTKVTHLDPPLSTTGTPLGAAPGPGDIALYVPSGNLGLYYGQLQHWDGAVILGKFNGDPNLIAKQTQPFTVTIEVRAVP